MTILLDTDILIDCALNRQPHAEAAANLLDALQKNPGIAYVAWHTLSNFFYMVTGSSGKRFAKGFIVDLCHFVQVSPTTTEDVLAAASLPLSDFEDALQVAAAMRCRAGRIVTRNVRHYRESPVPVVTPMEAMRILSEE